MAKIVYHMHSPWTLYYHRLALMKAMQARGFEVIAWVATRPSHVNISEVVMTPVAQASLTKVHRG